jgi:CsoR family transcriptional regulator, copper-sensing transcriptional repressor
LVRSSTKSPRKAEGVDPDRKIGALTRLKRIEGQIRGVQKMVEEERYCADILVQVSAIHESLRSVAELMLRNHLEHCAASAIRSGDRQRADAMYDELTRLFATHLR